MANSVDHDQTAPIGAVCSGSTLLASILKSSVMLGYLQQTTSADDIFRYRIFLGALRVNNPHRKICFIEKITISVYFIYIYICITLFLITSCHICGVQ